ncbi:hypothetical protein F443_23122, partial [Phytophthora nicotianae P1569]
VVGCRLAHASYPDFVANCEAGSDSTSEQHQQLQAGASSILTSYNQYKLPRLPSCY